jgi:hypothetical protein
MILGVDDLGLAAFCALVAMLVAAVVYAVSQIRKGFSVRKLLIAVAVCSLVLAALNWIAKSAVTRVPKDQAEKIRASIGEKN